MEDVTDELCGMTVIPVAVRVTTHDPVARFVPLPYDLVPLGSRPVLEIRHDGAQIAVLTDRAGFDLVDYIR
jgi:hypothetical protein